MIPLYNCNFLSNNFIMSDRRLFFKSNNLNTIRTYSDLKSRIFEDNIISIFAVAQHHRLKTNWESKSEKYGLPQKNLLY